ncbi:MAG: 2-dehydropantoate 2-reductase [Desulfobulbaceae bacterium]|nr:MAG: 2-dehydropantoate 2-reductase [Desulfobulbaceae bacterium]
MSIVIVGPGALGCLLASRLYLAVRRPGPTDDHDQVCLLDHNRQRAIALNRRGLFMEDAQASPSGRLMAPPGPESTVSYGPLMIAVGADPAVITGAKLILLCVKAFALPRALAEISPFLVPSALLIALQNGISHLELMRQMSARCRPALGVSTEGANLTAMGRVRYGGAGLTQIGYLSASAIPDDPLIKAVSTLNRAGIRTEISEDIQRALWLKLIVNAGINALTVIHDCPNGELLKIPAARKTMAAVVREAAAVAAAAGAAPNENPVTSTEEICRQTAANLSSMLQDVRRGKPTEIMAINGEVVRRATQYGLAVPANRELVAKVQRYS